jgi:hypothetical protein
MWKLRLPIVMAMSLMGLCISVAYADGDEKQNLGAVASMMPTVKVTLQQGLTAANTRDDRSPESSKSTRDIFNSPFTPHREGNTRRVWSTTTPGSLPRVSRLRVAMT